MPPLSSKNRSLSVTDMGLGDLLGQQVEDETEEMKRKRRMDARAQSLNVGSEMLGQGPRDILGGFFGR